MAILIETVRIKGFRGLKNVDIDLKPITVLTGMNNSGKTSLLKALQIALGNRQFLSHDDFYISNEKTESKIIIDLKIVPISSSDNTIDNFTDDWEILFRTSRIRQDEDGNSFVLVRTVVEYDNINSKYETKHYILNEWPDYKDWDKVDNGSVQSFSFEELQFFFMDAQRDILEDMKVKNSYLGKMLSEIKYAPKDIREIEDQIKILNEKAVNSSEILSNIRDTLKELNTAIAKKWTYLNKQIYFLWIIAIILRNNY